ncbi:hypothetical protein [Methanococcus maripaludis]|uniref:Uncharacterized protein n=1 Tax=Methanococcus maripaludis TaxID=39152 RepID=A0A7J9S1V1_METMI|nr:hypothetical protein [Methanococcus maripaludis]MBB6067924.1 hypothetical protein [Methanococcus maripaludis]
MCENSEKEKLIKCIESRIELINTDIHSVSVSSVVNKKGVTLQIKDNFSGELHKITFKNLKNAFEFLRGIYYGANLIIKSNLSDLMYRC